MKRSIIVIIILFLLWVFYTLLNKKKNIKVKDELNLINKNIDKIRTTKDKEEILKKLNSLEKQYSNKKVIEDIRVIRSKIMGIVITTEVKPKDIKKSLEDTSKPLKNIKKCSNVIVTVKPQEKKQIVENIKKINNDVVKRNIKELEKEVKKVQLKQSLLIPVMLPLSNIVIKKSEKLDKVKVSKHIENKPKLTKVYLSNIKKEILIDLKKSDVLAKAKVTKDLPKKMDIKKLEKEVKKEQIKQLLLIPAMIPLKALFDKSKEEEIDKFLKEHNYAITHNELNRYEVNQLKELLKKNKNNEKLKKIYKKIEDKDKKIKEDAIKEAKEEELKKKQLEQKKLLEDKLQKENMKKLKERQLAIQDRLYYVKSMSENVDEELDKAKLSGGRKVIKVATNFIGKCGLLAGGLLLGISNPIFFLADAFLLNSMVRSIRYSVTNKSTMRNNPNDLIKLYRRKETYLENGIRYFNDSLYQISALKNEFTNKYGSQIYFDDELLKFYNTLNDLEMKFNKQVKETEKKKDQIRNKVKVLKQ